MNHRHPVEVVVFAVSCAMPEALQRAQPQAIMIKIYHNRCGGA
jgi:hypothetical protein